MSTNLGQTLPLLAEDRLAELYGEGWRTPKMVWGAYTEKLTSRQGGPVRLSTVAVD